MTTITWDEFAQVEIRCGTVVDVQPFPEARTPAWLVHVDFGPELGVKKTSARITDLYDADALLGKQVMGVTNLPTKQIGPVQSQFLLVGFYRDDGAVVLAVPDSTAPNGSKLA